MNVMEEVRKTSSSAWSMLGRGIADVLGVGDSAGTTASVGAALATGAAVGVVEADGAGVGAAPPRAASGSFVLGRSAEVRWRCSTSGGPRERADDNARVRRGPGGSVADRPEARAKTRADDARVTAFELLGDRPRVAAGPGLRLRAGPAAGRAAPRGAG